jgi:hypothetical protein
MDVFSSTLKNPGADVIFAGQGMSDGSAALVPLETSSKIASPQTRLRRRAIRPAAVTSMFARLVPDICSTA